MSWLQFQWNPCSFCVDAACLQVPPRLHTSRQSRGAVSLSWVLTKFQALSCQLIKPSHCLCMADLFPPVLQMEALSFRENEKLVQCNSDCQGQDLNLIPSPLGSRSPSFIAPHTASCEDNAQNCRGEGQAFLLSGMKASDGHWALVSCLRSTWFWSLIAASEPWLHHLVLSLLACL